MMSELQLHPLINPNSTHYDIGPITAIEELEQQLTVTEMIGFCKANIFKYEYRKEHKGQAEEDDVKINTYEKYLKVLFNIDTKFTNNTVAFVFCCLGIKWRYR
jgi:hypothetical protein